MKQTTNFNIYVPELGDRPDITQVSDAIQDLEDALAGTLEVMVASIDGSKVAFTSPSRTTKRTQYYEGMSVQFIAPIQMAEDSVRTMSIDDLPEQQIYIPYLINSGESATIYYDGSKFIGAMTAVPKSPSVELNSNDTVATSLAVKTAYDKAMEAFAYAKALCPYRVGDILITNIKENPAITWLGTSWSRIEGRSLRATSGEQESGLLLGSDSVTIGVNNMPSHSHDASGSTDSKGDHTHGASGSSDVQGWHSHNANHGHSAYQDAHLHSQPGHQHAGNLAYPYTGGGSINPVSNNSGYGTWWSGAAGGENTGGAQPAVYVNANNFDVAGNGSHSHNISVSVAGAGAHTHNVSVSVGATGGSEALSVLNASYTVHMWIRTE